MCCISLYSYIKPQRRAYRNLSCQVVYLYIPTSNHNCAGIASAGLSLYIFIFLHQTTTYVPLRHRTEKLYIFIFLHQTTTDLKFKSDTYGCISLYSYIKPQHICIVFVNLLVVYLYIPTSNHNRSWFLVS